MKYSFYSNVYKQDFTPLHIETQQCTKNDERGYVATNIYPEKKKKNKRLKYDTIFANVNVTNVS